MSEQVIDLSMLPGYVPEESGPRLVRPAVTEASDSTAVEVNDIPATKSTSVSDALARGMGAAPPTPIDIGPESVEDAAARTAQDEYFARLAAERLATEQAVLDRAEFEDDRHLLVAELGGAVDAMLEGQFDPSWADEGTDLETQAESAAVLRELGDLAMAAVDDPEIVATVAAQAAWFAVAQKYGYSGPDDVNEIASFLQSDVYVAREAMNAGDYVSGYVQSQVEAEQAELAQVEQEHMNGARAMSALEAIARVGGISVDQIENPDAELGEALALVGRTLGAEGLQVMGTGSPEEVAQTVTQAVSVARLQARVERKQGDAAADQQSWEKLNATSVSRGLANQHGALRPLERIEPDALTEEDLAFVLGQPLRNPTAQIGEVDADGMPISLSRPKPSIQDGIHEAIRQQEIAAAKAKLEELTGKPSRDLAGRFVKRGTGV